MIELVACVDFLGQPFLWVAFIVTEWPHEVGGSHEGCPSQVPQHPNYSDIYRLRPSTQWLIPRSLETKRLTCWPKTAVFGFTRKLGTEFNNAPYKAELVPPLQHASLNMLCIGIKFLGLFIEGFVKVCFDLSGDIQHAVCCYGIVVMIKMQG